MGEVVELTYTRDQVAVISMEDRAARNTFSKDIVLGLNRAFSEIGQSPSVKAVVIHGYESVFCAGGTLEELLAIADRKLSFEAGGFYRLLLDCPVPVIAAMQGHALGGGLVFGLYADIILLSEESIYSANFMKYGFTPGMGATLIVPEKFGAAIGDEMLLTAGAYHGGELAKRGVGPMVLPRREVVTKAKEIALDLADKPTMALRLLKERLTTEIKNRLAKVEVDEQAMHDVTFAQSDIRKRIESRYGA